MHSHIKPHKNKAQLKNKYYAVDCFAGCGGLSEGLRKAGFSVLAGIEINVKAQDAHKLNHPGTLLYSDIRDIDHEAMMKELGLRKGELDLLAGCPPCQGFSTMRTRNGSEKIDDPRNKLIYDFVRLAIELEPKTILMENVPGLMKDSRFSETKRRLAKAGYKWIMTDIHDAALFGVAQRRRRMIMMASRLGPFEDFSGSESKITVRNVIGRLSAPGKSKNRLHKLHMNHSDVVMDRIKRIPKNGGSRSALGEDQLACHKEFQGFRDVYGRMKWNDVAPTITRFCHNPSKGRFLHPEQDRAITIYEAMRLQSFPFNYRFPKCLSMTEIASLIGEALPPKFAKAQAHHIINHIEAFE